MPLAPGQRGCVTGITPRVLSLPASGSERSQGQVLSASGPRFPSKVMKAGTGSPTPEGTRTGAGTAVRHRQGQRGHVITGPSGGSGKDPWGTGRTPWRWLEWQPGNFQKGLD